MKIIRRLVISIFITAVMVGGLFYFRYQVHNSRGSFEGKKILEITKGEGMTEVAAKLRNEGLISGKMYFYYYLRSNGLKSKILPGKYELSGNMTIPEIATIITNEENILPGYSKITFPEGWTSKQMAERLNANGLDGDGFLGITRKPSQELISKFAFLAGAKSLEGYLFPDTYFLAKDISAEGIVLKMLNNFDNKLDENLRDEIIKQKKTSKDILTMASILEMEVKSDADRAIVSGIYWNRLKIGQPLQSDITLTYVLGEKKKQYSTEDTQTPSPYNTYLNKGLPPGPIGNPGMSAIRAAIYPQDTEYNYYLSDPATGETIYAKNFEEHLANKAKYGL